MAFEVTRDTLLAQAIRYDGTVLDKFELKKSEGRISPDYLAQVYPEERLKLFYESIPSLASWAASVPGTNEPAKVSLKISPLKGSTQSADLEISLDPGSRPYYELENGPLRASMPLAEQTNQTIWADVRATGRKAVSASRSGELAPPLVFMAKVRARAQETVSYGVPCRLSTKATAAKR